MALVFVEKKIIVVLFFLLNNTFKESEGWGYQKKTEILLGYECSLGIIACTYKAFLSQLLSSGPDSQISLLRNLGAKHKDYQILLLQKWDAHVWRR